MKLPEYLQEQLVNGLICSKNLGQPDTEHEN